MSNWMKTAGGESGTIAGGSVCFTPRKPLHRSMAAKSQQRRRAKPDEWLNTILDRPSRSCFPWSETDLGMSIASTSRSRTCTRNGCNGVETTSAHIVARPSRRHRVSHVR